MKKLYRWASVYAILAIIGGVFYREFTKINMFTGKTTLSFLHVHLFVFGMIMFIILMLMEKQSSISTSKRFKRFMIVYNTGLLGSVGMLLIRGYLQVLPLANTTMNIDAMISGMAGVFHIVLGIGLYNLFLIIKEKML